MSNHRDHSKQRKNEHPLKNLPTEVLLKARSTLFSLGGALKPKHDQLQQQRPKLPKQETKDKKSNERLKSSRSEPEFSEVRKNKHRSRIEDSQSREYADGLRPRPLSVGATKRYDKDLEYFHSGNFPREPSPLHRQFESAEEVCVQSRLVIPVIERLNQDVHMQDVSERPRKKLSFREPEIVSSGSATLGRSHKIMGVNSLSKRPNRVSLRSEQHSSSLEGLDSDLESQAMRIVRTVGQAFEVCHKMQVNSPEQPAPSTSSAPDEPVAGGSDIAASKEAGSECGASEGAGSTSKVIVEEGAEGGREERPKHLNLLPPPPRKEKRTPQRTTPALTINLPDLPECVTKIDLVSGGEEAADAATPLSAQHQLQLLRERLEQQAQQTRAAVAQLLLLRDQLAAEQAARCEAQARTHQLLVHNKELLEHIAALVAHLQERERGSSRPISAQQLTLLPQLSSSAKIDRWFSLLPANTPALSRPESGFISGVEDGADAATLAEAKNLLLQLGAKKKRRLIPLRFTRRKILVVKHCESNKSRNVLPAGSLANDICNLAPIIKKLGAGPTSKCGAGTPGSTGGAFGKSGSYGKSSSSKVSSGKLSSSPPKLSTGLGSSTSAKSTGFGASSSKSYAVSSYSTPKSKSSKAGFGIMWIPSRKHNKKKDIVYSGHDGSYRKGKYERSPSMYNYMSGDSPDFQPHKKKEEETDLLMPERTKAPITSIATVGTAVVGSEVPSDSTATGNTEEKQEFIRRDKNEDSKEAAGDTNSKEFKSEKDDDYLENDKVTNKSEKQDKDTEKYGDKVDSVYLRPPPAHKARSTASTDEEEDCGIKCLYYTIQCCDCVLM